ncbi:MAG: glycosyltransferase family A protein [Planctomycetota bacterium]
MSKPAFSVVVTACNRADMLADALGSVRAQTFGDYELIVVDDASTDDTAAVAEQFGARVLRQPTNQGVAAARTRAVREANADFIAFLDDDDRWPTWTLATYAAALAEHPDATIVSGVSVDFDKIDATPHAEPKWVRHDDYFAFRSRLPEEWLVPSGMAVRRSALLAAGPFNQKMVRSSDSEMWLRLGVEPGFVRVTQPPVFGFRHHAQRITANPRPLLDSMREMLRKSRVGAFPGGTARATERRSIVSLHTRNAARGLARRGSKWAGVKLWAASLPLQLRAGRWRFVLGYPVEMWLWPIKDARKRRRRRKAAQLSTPTLTPQSA